MDLTTHAESVEGTDDTTTLQQLMHRPQQDVNERFSNDMQSNIEFKIMASQIQKLFIALKEMDEKINKLDLEREKPTGCGFSCSNNSLNM